MSNIKVIMAGLAVIIAFAIISFAAAAQTSSDEQLQIEQELSAQWYEWLVNYTLNENEILSSQIEVYEKDGDTRQEAYI